MMTTFTRRNALIGVAGAAISGCALSRSATTTFFRDLSVEAAAETLAQATTAAAEHIWNSVEIVPDEPARIPLPSPPAADAPTGRSAVKRRLDDYRFISNRRLVTEATKKLSREKGRGRDARRFGDWYWPVDVVGASLARRRLRIPVDEITSASPDDVIYACMLNEADATMILMDRATLSMSARQSIRMDRTEIYPGDWHLVLMTSTRRQRHVRRAFAEVIKVRRFDGANARRITADL